MGQNFRGFGGWPNISENFICELRQTHCSIMLLWPASMKILSANVHFLEPSAKILS